MKKTDNDTKRANQERLRMQYLINERLQDLFDIDQEKTIICMLTLAISMMAKRNPHDLSANDKKKIKDNYSYATPELIKERSMSTDALLNIVSLFMISSRIAIDYSPSSHWKELEEIDNSISPTHAQIFCPVVIEEFKKAVKSGMTPFGAATTLILAGAAMSKEHGVPWPVMTRPLLDAFDIIVKDEDY